MDIGYSHMSFGFGGVLCTLVRFFLKCTGVGKETTRIPRDAEDLLQMMELSI